MVASTAYLLISHGSRDPRPQVAMDRLADLVRKHLEATPQQAAAGNDTPRSQTRPLTERTFFNSAIPHRAAERHKAADRTALLAKPHLEKAPTASSKVIVGTACLELSPIALSEQIYEFGRRLQAAGVRELKLLPVFLMPGVHVTEDIPDEVEVARALLGDSLQLTLCPHLGSHTKISEVLASRLAAVPAEGSLLVAHGSRKPRGNQAIKGLAKRLDTAVAYWSTPPDIETQVIDLMQQGCQRLAILPYFLFAGGITDAITHRTEELAERFPKVSFRLLPTLGATDEIASLAVELVNE
ncbi:CbiX/SirB N-terminal domain-containing protein [Leptolyngbya sp. BC1307]|uniref:sirohydrochlorin chelatase n=1 Tax=Leptolyngbya sp. BC1307 TaxID=2029589 RepID=UPI000EFB70AB|nr:CbiX/SirB N-terminal domain-containing protein [Leptolyngbya sp. BC1307]